MSCFDCKKQHHKCKAQCCGIVPIPKKTYDSNKHKIVNEPLSILDAEDCYIPITDNQYCPYLNKDLSCNIYDDRPDVCRKFGDESHPMLFCPVLNKNGQERCRQNRRFVERQTDKYMSKLKLYEER